MNFILIPFLLATDFISNDDAWNNGPEYSFSGTATRIIKSDSAEDEREIIGSTLQTTLKCRPREPDNLNCHFEDARVVMMLPEKFDFSETLPRQYASYSPYSPLRETNFEIKFDRNGIEEYIFEKDEKLMDQFLVDMFRMITNQLSVGTTPDGKEDIFRGKENFTMGKCPTDYNIFRSDVEDYCEKKKFNLVSLIDLELNNEEVLCIERTRVVNECLPHDLYYFGSRSIYDVTHKNQRDKLVSSTSSMMISTDCFISETLNSVDIYDETYHQDEIKIGSALDRIRVSLESIDPAQGSLKPISSPISVDVIVRNSSNYNATQ